MRSTIALALASATLLGSLLAAGPAEGSSAQFAGVRQATAGLHKVQKAEAAGYEKFLPCFDAPGVGGMDSTTPTCRPSTALWSPPIPRCSSTSRTVTACSWWLLSTSFPSPPGPARSHPCCSGSTSTATTPWGSGHCTRGSGVRTRTASTPTSTPTSGSVRPRCLASRRPPERWSAGSRGGPRRHGGLTRISFRRGARSRR